MNRSKHEFALYLNNLSQLLEAKKAGELLTIIDPELIRRVHTVLRLKPEETITLFDQYKNIVAELQVIEKKQIIIKINQVQHNKAISPSIRILLPLLKREALSDAIYSCVELGAQEIQLVQTEKSQRIYNMQHLEKITIAAAEQSKNFSMATLHEPISLTDAIKNSSAKWTKIFFDAEGLPAKELVSNVNSQEPLLLLIGPEGDLTDAEKELVRKNNFIFYALTPTVLRAQQALAVGLGLMRSLSFSAHPEWPPTL